MTEKPAERKIIFLGEPLEEINARGGHSIAGDAVNFAVGAARMDANLKAALASDTKVTTYVLAAVGDDARSDMIRQYLNANNVSTELLSTIGGKKAGAYTIKLDAHGERTFEYHDRDDAAFRDLFHTEEGMRILGNSLETIDENTTLVLSGITISRVRDTAGMLHLLDYVQAAKQQGARIVVDANYRASLWPDERTAREFITPFLHEADTVYISRPSDSKLWVGEDTIRNVIGSTFTHRDTKHVVVKQGEKGSGLYWRDKARNLQTKFIAAHEVNVVDTTGAGDTLMAAAELALAHGADMEHAQLIGARAAAHVIQQHGGVLDETNVPTLEQWQRDEENLKQAREAKQAISR